MAKCGVLLLLLAFLSAVASEATSCHPDDLRALQCFAGNLRGGGAVLLRASWSGVSCCGWEGVACGGAGGRVTALWLPGRALAGTFPGPSLAGLVRLRSLNLANNRLTDTVPSWIGDFEQLSYLDLSGNSLVGEVPKRLMRPNGLTTVGGSPGMAFTNKPFYVNPSRRVLDDQPNTISGTNNTVKSGNNNIVSGNDNTVVSGDRNNLSGSNNTVVAGSDNTVTGSNHVVSGTNHIVTDNNNNVTGDNNNVSGSFHTVSGAHNTVSGSNNTVSGSNHVVTDG